jgi:hypothetical protein
MEKEMTRLPYETRAGQPSEADTFAQLLEYLRLAEEAAYLIGHLRNAQNDKLEGRCWLEIGEMLKFTQKNITSLATKRFNLRTGYRQ